MRFDTALGECGLPCRHDFLGWTELKAIAKDTEQSRALFADILADEKSRRLLLGIARPHEEAVTLFRAGWNEFGPKPDPKNGFRQAPPPPFPVLAALLLAETAVPKLTLRFNGGAEMIGIGALLETEEGKLAATGKGRYGTVFQSVCYRWVETRGALDEYQLGDTFCRRMNLGEELRTTLRLRIVDDPAMTAVVKQQVLMKLAETDGRKYLGRFRKYLADDSLIRPHRVEDQTQLRDMALVAVLLVTDQKPKDYGYTIVVGEKPELKFMYFNYRFAEGNGKSMDDLRKVAFAKWAAWEKEHLKPDEKK